MPFFHKNVSQEQVQIHFAILPRGLLPRSRGFELHKEKRKWSRTPSKIVKDVSIQIIFRNKCSMVFVKKKRREKVTIIKTNIIYLG